MHPVTELLACPHCGDGLTVSGPVTSCPQGHTFDVARQGYLSLLAAGSHAGTADTPAMVAARERFLAGGHFDAVDDLLVRCAVAAIGRRGLVVDAGAGTGHHLARVLDGLPERWGLALELSKPALRRAARCHPRLVAVACDVWGAWPLRTASCGLALSVFAPRNAGELRRVLADDGALLVVTPARSYLSELRAAGLMLQVDQDKDARLAEQLHPLFRLEQRHDLDQEWTLTHAELHDLVSMGPTARHTSPEAIARRVAQLPATLRVGAAVSVAVWRAAAVSTRTAAPAARPRAAR